MNDYLKNKRYQTGKSTAMIRCLNMNWGEQSQLDCNGCLIEFLNRPFLHHVVETLIQHGFWKFEFHCEGSLIPYRTQMGLGERWGVEFKFAKDNNLAFGESQPNDAHVFGGHSLPYSSKEQGGLLRIDTTEHYLQAQRQALTIRAESMLTIERQQAPSVWVGRNASIHPSAIVRGPVLIGENSRIGSGAVLGPNTVIGSNCMIDRNTSIGESTVFSNVYVGEGLSISDSIVSKGGVVNIRLGAELAIQDDLLVGQFP